MGRAVTLNRLGGFATLTAVGLMVFLTALLMVEAQQSSTIELSLQKARLGDRNAAYDQLAKALDQMEKEWVPQSMSFHTWAASHPIDGVEWESMSGKVNLNTASVFLLSLPDLAASFVSGGPQIILDERQKQGLYVSPTELDKMVAKEALTRWYTLHSLWNINTADESAVEQMVSERTGSTTLGSAVRAQLRTYRSQLKRLSAADLEALAGTLGVSAPLFTIEPELDVNEASVSLLDAFLTNPAWNVASGRAKAQTLVQKRESQPWTTAALKDLLAVDDTNLILSYLGTRSRFFGGVVKTPHGMLNFVVFSEGKLGDPPRYRIVSTQWSGA